MSRLETASCCICGRQWGAHQLRSGGQVRRFRVGRWTRYVCAGNCERQFLEALADVLARFDRDACAQVRFREACARQRSLPLEAGGGE